jgi:hypothetical protein
VKSEWKMVEGAQGQSRIKAELASKCDRMLSAKHNVPSLPRQLAGNKDNLVHTLEPWKQTANPDTAVAPEQPGKAGVTMPLRYLITSGLDCLYCALGGAWRRIQFSV